MESAFGMRILDADPGEQNHADPCGCGCGSVTLNKTVKNIIICQKLDTVSD
jgi:hypothetical protein